MRRALARITKRGMAATKTHYDRVAASYHDAYFYSDAYERWQRDEVLQRLDLQPHHRVADIGGGTGRFVGLLKEPRASRRRRYVWTLAARCSKLVNAKTSPSCRATPAPTSTGSSRRN